MRPLHPAEVIARWQGLAGAGEFAGLAEELMALHYDPRYAKHRDRMAVPFADVAAADLSEAALPGLADRVADAVRGLV